MKAIMITTRNNLSAKKEITKGKAKIHKLKRHLCILAFPFVISFFEIPISAQETSNLLSEMTKSENAISYSATQTGSGGTARVYRSGRKRRLEWLAPSVKRGDVLVDDGTHVFLYHRAERSATKTDSRGFVLNFSAAGSVSPTTFAGRRAFLVPVSGRRTLVIDAQTKALLAVRGASGGYALSNIRFGAVPESRFQFIPPQGVALTAFDGSLYANVNAAKRAARWLKTPAHLPSGWKFESAIVGQNSAWLRYSNGQNRFSLFEQPTTGGYLAPRPVNGGTFWKNDGVRFLATGISGSALDELTQALK